MTGVLIHPMRSEETRNLSAVGSTIFEGRFEVRALLGIGSFGRVSHCFDREAQREVALKELNRFGADALLRFKKEFRTLTDVHHPNLVRLFELLESDDRRWAFTMELVPGTDFLSWVRGGDHACGYHEDRLREALGQLTKGLVSLHGLGMLHRDVKPENIRVTPEGRVVLLDFGLVTHLEAGKQTTEAAGVGTAAYMAPEQASQRVGPEADFYAVGVLLYEALTGRLPFEGSAVSILIDKSMRPPPSPRQHNADVASDLERLSLALLERDIGRRAGANDVLHTLGIEVSRSFPALLTSGGHSPSALVGRERELQALHEEWQLSQQNGFRVVLIEGTSGIGKTALMDAAVAQLAVKEPGLLTLRGRCHAAEQVRYKVWDGVADALCRYLLGLPRAECAALIPDQADYLSVLFPVLARVDALPKRAPSRLRIDTRAQRFAMFEQFGELLARVTRVRPIVICVDDLQWGDLDSLAVLQVLLSLPNKSRLLFLGTVRPLDELEQELASKLHEIMRSSTRFARLSVGTLDEVASTRLSADLLGLPLDHPTVLGVTREALGNPWSAVQMTHALEELGDHDAPLRDFDGTLRRRIEKLGPDAQRVMELLAVAGGPQPSAVIRRALGIDGSAFEQAMATLRAHKLSRPATRGTWVCYHDRVREAIVADLSGAVIKATHSHLAQAWQREGGAPERIAAHFRAAEERTLALPWLERAADAAEQTGAYGQAVELYREALSIREQRGEPPADLKPLRLALAETLSSAGRGAESARALLGLLETAGAAERAGLKVRAAEQLLRAGQVQEGLAAAKVAFESLEMPWPKSPTRALVRMLWQNAALSLRGYKVKLRPEPLPLLDQARLDALVRLSQPLSWADLVRAGELSIRYLRAALDGGERDHVGRALLLQGLMAAMQGPDGKLASELFAQADPLVERSQSASLVALRHFAHGAAMLSTGHAIRAAPELEAAHATYETHCASETWQIANVRSVYMPARIAVGDHRSFLADAERWISDALLRGDTFAFTSCVVTGAGYTRHLMADAPARALDEIDTAMAVWEGETFGIQHCFALTSRQVVHCYAGGVNALEAIEREWPRARKSVLWRMGMTRELLLVSRGYAALSACAVDPDNVRYRQVLSSACADLAKARSYLGRSSGHFILAQKAWLEGEAACSTGA